MLNSIGKKMLFWVLAVVIVPLGLVSFTVFYLGKHILKEQIYSTLAVTADSVEAQTLALIDSKINRTRDFSSDGFIHESLKILNAEPRRKDATDALINHLIKNKKPVDKNILDIFAFDRKGRLAASTDIERFKKNLAEPEYFERGKTGIGVGTIESVRDERRFSISAPLYSATLLDKRGAGFLGVITISFNALAIDDILTTKAAKLLGAPTVFGTFGKTTRMYIVDKEKTVISSNNPDIIGRTADLSIVNRTLSSGEETIEEFTGITGEERIGSTMYLEEPGWVVVVSLPKKEVFAPIERLEFWAYFFILAGTAGAAAFTVIYARKLTLSLAEVSNAASRIANGNLDERIKTTGGDEIAELGQNFNNMAAKLKESFGALKQSEEDMRLLQSVTSSVAEAEDVKSSIHAALKKICDASGWAYGEAWMPSPDKTALTFLNAYMGETPDPKRKVFKKLSEDMIFLPDTGLPGRIYASKKAELVPDVSVNGAIYLRAKAALEAGFKMALGVPITSDGDVLSVLVFYMTEHGRKEERSIKLISSVATQLGAVIKRKFAENSLRESENKYKTLVENLPQRIFLKNKDLFYVSCNENYARDLKITPGDIAGKTDFDFYPKELAEKYRSDDMTVMESGEITDMERRYVQNEQESFVHIVKVPVKDNSGKTAGVLGIFRDITEQKKAQEEKEKLEQQLRQSQKMEALGQLTGGIAHDFNNLLAVVTIAASMLEKKLEKDQNLLSIVRQIVLAAEKAATLTSGLLAFSRKQVMNKRPVYANDILRSVANLLEKIIGENVTLDVKLSEEDTSVSADPGQMEQVFINLVTNARDAMPRGGVIFIETKLVDMDERFPEPPLYGKTGRYVLISVTDTGEGMDEKTKDRIFEPFFTTKETGKGTGLGLAIVYGIIKQHDGYINVYSAPGSGTTFKIYLPLARPKKEEPFAKKSVIPAGGTETVLLAEDEEEVRRLTKTMLEDYGYKVIEAVNGQEALEKFTANRDRIDLLVFDLIMPGKSGKETFEEIKKTDPGVKILFMSGYSEEFAHKSGVIGEGLDFISKPFVPSEFLKKVREIIDR